MRRIFNLLPIFFCFAVLEMHEKINLNFVPIFLHCNINNAQEETSLFCLLKKCFAAVRFTRRRNLGIYPFISVLQYSTSFINPLWEI